MSDGDDDYAYFGTPLEQFDEETVPRKKPLTVQEQIATDKHGRRRFHGAFTGGFSAGFYNSVGSLEGWTPASFKSSRNKKADSKSQKPEDFMDDEDLEEFGIAPTVVRTKPEYSGNKVPKRERIQFSDGPIPGEPVLKSILEPVRKTVGVLLLMKMGWKPGQGVGPRLTRLQKKRNKEKNKMKIYGCSLSDQRSDSDDNEDIDESIIDPNVLFAPEEHEIYFLHPKMNTFGMDYSGLDKNALFSKNSTLASETFKIIDSNRKLAIKGQAFGVGAFEEDDDDIYAREDMSQYDFALDTSGSLKEKRRKEREARKELAITGSDDVLEGFVPARNTPPRKKFFPPPELPPDYEPVHHQRKSRFDSDSSVLQVKKEVKNKHFITPGERAAILGETRPNEVKTKTFYTEEDNMKIIISPLQEFRPFISDPEKQERYEKYIHFTKIGAVDIFPSIQPKSFSDWEKERERNEFEQAVRLYQPLSGMMAERFAHGELPDDSADPLAVVPTTFNKEDQEMLKAANAKMYGKLTRRIIDWAPSSLLCKRMNIAEPSNSVGVSLTQVASNKQANKNKLSVFSFLEVTKGNSLEESKQNQEKIIKENDEVTEIKLPENEPETFSFPKSVTDLEDPLDKRDLFKAIFCSDEDESDSEEKKERIIAEESSQERVQPEPEALPKVLRNTSPPRGIFANLDLDALNKRKSTTYSPPTTATLTKSSNFNEEVKSKEVEETFLYGPSLPTKPIYSLKQKEELTLKSSSESSSEDEWVERKEIKEKKKSKKHKKHKIKKNHRSKNRRKESKK